MNIPTKPSGFGSNINGGELLFLALATCYCNDIYRESQKRNIKIESVEVNVEGEFSAEGEPARYINYTANVVSDEDEDIIRELLNYTDKVAEIQNTLRKGIDIKLKL